MTRTVFANSMVAHVWAQQNQSDGRSSNGNFYFRGPALYSYGRHFPCAVFSSYRDEDGRRVVFTNDGTYSVSTSRHMHDMRGALRGLDVRTVGIPCEAIRAFAAVCESNPESETYRKSVAEAFRLAMVAAAASIAEHTHNATRRVRAQGGRHKYGPDRGKAWHTPAIEARTIHEAAAYKGESGWSRFAYFVDEATAALHTHDFIARLANAKPLARKGEAALDTLERLRLDAAAAAAKEKADKAAKSAATIKATLRAAISTKNRDAIRVQTRVADLVNAAALEVLNRNFFADEVASYEFKMPDPAEVAENHGIAWREARLEVNAATLRAARTAATLRRWKATDPTAAAFLKRHKKALEETAAALQVLENKTREWSDYRSRIARRGDLRRRYANALKGGNGMSEADMAEARDLASRSGRLDEAATILRHIQTRRALKETDETSQAARIHPSRYDSGYATPYNRPRSTVTLEAWTAGIGAMNQPHLGTAVRRVGSRLETSRGAEAPFAHAVAIFRLAQSCRHAGRNWTPGDEQVRAGNFTLNRINWLGDIQVGCHSIAFDEMLRLAVREVPEVVKPRFQVPAVI